MLPGHPIACAERPKRVMQVFSVMPRADVAMDLPMDMVTGTAVPQQRAKRHHHAMVGRAAIISLVEELAARLVYDGRSSLLMMSAPSGFGKTALLKHLAQENVSGVCSHFHIFQATGTAELRPYPYSPWRVVIMV